MATAILDPLGLSLQNRLNSTTTLRAPYTTTAGLSMAESLPPLNFGFDNLRARMNAFTARFDEFIERGRKRVLDERNQFHMAIAEINDQQAAKTRSIIQLEQESEQYAQALTAQTAESSEISTTIASLTATRDARAEQLGRLKQKSSATRSEITQRKIEQKKQAQWLQGMRSLDREEVIFWEEALGLRVEGAAADDGRERVRFVMPALQASRGRDGSTEAWFELDMGQAQDPTKGVEITATWPRLENGVLSNLAKELNEGEDLGAFLKGMREMLQRTLR